MLPGILVAMETNSGVCLPVAVTLFWLCGYLAKRAKCASFCARVSVPLCSRFACAA
jgi:hypothetical protein